MDDQAVTDLLDRIHARRGREQVPPLSPALAHRISDILLDTGNEETGR